MSERADASDAFPCAQCGALQTWSPDANALLCPYCGHQNPVPESLDAIREVDFHAALGELQAAQPATPADTTRCVSCAAEFTFDEHVHSDLCPYCGTPIVRQPGEYRHFKPQSLLAFSVNEAAALDAFRAWQRGLWFAPGSLDPKDAGQDRLVGVYVPFWTYDSHTSSDYDGERGTVYTQRVPVYETVNGQRVRRMRSVQRIRWRPARGRVSRFFDDVLVGATRSLPRKITEAIAPWDLEGLVPYDPGYLSGFRSEVYQVDLDEGFERARHRMDAVIRNDIRRDIGGDAQRIHRVNTSHRDTTFKHVLLPVWSAAFRHRGKSYRFVVNGRTGRVAGERPYSVMKIAGAIAAGVLVAALIALASSGAG